MVALRVEVDVDVQAGPGPVGQADLPVAEPQRVHQVGDPDVCERVSAQQRDMTT